MLNHIRKRLLSRLAKIGANENTPAEFTPQESLIVQSVLFIYLWVGVGWGAIYYFSGEPVIAIIPTTYTIILGIMLPVFLWNRNVNLFLSVHSFSTLILPFALQLALGGFVPSSAVIIWSFLAPLSAMVLADQRAALRGFLSMLLLLIVAGILNPYLTPSNNLSDAAVLNLFVLNIGTVLGIAFVLLYYFINQKDHAYVLLDLEQKKSEDLLLNILPKKIAATLKNERRTIAENIEEASILFADLVGFTTLTADLSPTELIELLNDVYSHLDDLVEKYGVEKIRTIGDNYMAVAGVPTARPDHAQALARMALDINLFCLNYRFNNETEIQFRIGINSGSMVAGVVGHKKFQYDVWGDSVNVASRMESHGKPGKIQITAATYALIEDEFICQPRGTIEIKSKGAMETYWLLKEKPSSS